MRSLPCRVRPCAARGLCRVRAVRPAVRLSIRAARPVPSRAPCAPSSTGNAPQPCAMPSRSTRKPSALPDGRAATSAGSTGKPSTSKRVNLCAVPLPDGRGLCAMPSALPSARRARPVPRPRRASVCRPVHPRRAPLCRPVRPVRRPRRATRRNRAPCAACATSAPCVRLSACPSAPRASVPSRAPCAPSSTGNALQPCAVPPRRPDPRASRRRCRMVAPPRLPDRQASRHAVGVARLEFPSEIGQ